MINDKCHTAQACASIGELAHMTTVDVLNIIHALRLRNAKTPLQQQGRQMHEMIAGSELAVIDTAGHLSAIDQPDAFAKLIGDFIGRND